MKQLFKLHKHLSIWHQRFVKDIWRPFVKKVENLCSSDHPIMFKFCWPMTQIVNKGITNDIFRCQHLQR